MTENISIKNQGRLVTPEGRERSYKALRRLDTVWGGAIDRSMDKTCLKTVSRDECKSDYEYLVRNGIV